MLGPGASAESDSAFRRVRRGESQRNDSEEVARMLVGELQHRHRILDPNVPFSVPGDGLHCAPIVPASHRGNAAVAR
jgi:hypothetical protein